MTIDEAIKHAEEIAEKKESERQKWDEWLEHDSDYRATAEKESCELCATEHRQLAEWLKELKAYREREPSYEAGYNDAKREIALSGEYKRAYDRGYEQACKDEKEAGKCGDCISRKAAFKALQIKGDYNTLNEVYDRLEKLPSVKSERKPGKWVDGKCNRCGANAPFWAMATTYYCSEYCPKCGARMEVDG